MNASIVGRYGFRRKSEQRQVALERAWLEVKIPAVGVMNLSLSNVTERLGFDGLDTNWVVATRIFFIFTPS